MNVVVHFDYDGTLAEFRDLIPQIKETLTNLGKSLASIEDVLNSPEKLNKEIYKILKKKDYFYNLAPQQNVIDFAKNLTNEGYDTRLLSCIVSSQAQSAKNLFMEDFLPEIKKNKRIYVPDEDRLEKYKFIHVLEEPEDSIHILIDDNSDNCRAFEAALKEAGDKGFAIKMFNDINGIKGTWQGPTLDYLDDPKTMEDMFDNYINSYILENHLEEDLEK